MKKEPKVKAAVIRAVILVTLAALTSIVAAGCAASKAGSKPSDLDYSKTRTSQNGVFRGTFVSITDPVPLNRIHSWRVHVEDPGGRPITEAGITVDGGMPEHGHGLPTKPLVTQNLGNGDYLVEGMKFQMHGWWVVNFTIAAGGKNDTVTFNLRF